MDGQPDLQMLARPALEVAPLLLGALLTANGVSLRITEVEAYLGGDDPGSHAFRGPTRRNATMFGEAGALYTYLSYGIHVCANVVCSPAGTASGVLLRAGQIVAGIELARSRRATTKTDADLARGPARLTVALGITLIDDGADLGSGGIRLQPAPPEPHYAQGPRTGVSGTGGSDRYPWRFWIPDDATVSPHRAGRITTRG